MKADIRPRALLLTIDGAMNHIVDDTAVDILGQSFAPLEKISIIWWWVFLLAFGLFDLRLSPSLPR